MRGFGLKGSIALVGASLLSCLAIADTATTAGQRVLFMVSQDESSVEEAIGSYLQKEGFMVAYVDISKDRNKEDKALVIPFGNMRIVPDFRIFIDTLPSGRQRSTKKILERVVLIRLLTRTYVRKGHETALLKCLNAYHRDRWAGRFYIDKDGELVADWPLNILGTGLPADLVNDAVVRLISGWSSLYTEVKPHVSAVSGKPESRGDGASSQNQQQTQPSQ